MKDQHTKITGYRDLSQTEIDLMNEIKAHGVALGALVAKLREYRPTGDLEVPHIEPDGRPTLDQRWISIGATHMQEGLMALTRGIAQPTSF